MIELRTKDDLPLQDDNSASDLSDGFLAFMVKLLGAFATVDPRVITPAERRDGRASFGL
jgi:hypothetical protein